MSAREATSALGLEPTRSLRVELKLSAVEHPLLMRHLQSVPKKMQAGTILALAERGAREFYLLAVADEASACGERIRNLASASERVGEPYVGQSLTATAMVESTREANLDWLDESGIKAFSDFGTDSSGKG